jgi:2-succinyl-6-hydroxy-2,4-cyclohexadiene-1-carboxylate synthase
MPELLVDGLRFHVAEQGRGDPLVLLHGFTGSAASWWPVCDRLATHHRVVAPDLIGHGLSAAPASPDRYQFHRALDDLAAIAGQLGIDRAAWLGYSMGGRLALGLALEHPHLVSALVLESASPGIADPAARETRRRSDASVAASIEAEGIAAFVDRWERLPLWSSQQSLPAETRRRLREVRLRNRPRGLANSLRGMGQGSQSSYWPRLGEIAVPVRLIVGEHDDKFVGLARRMQRSICEPSLEIVPGAGHAVHLEQPGRYAAAVIDFLNRGSQPAVSGNEERYV